MPLHLTYECQIHFRGREVETDCVLGIDAAGRPGLVSAQIYLGRDMVRYNKGVTFDRIAAYLRAVHWQDILLQFEIRRQELDALAERFERLETGDRIAATIAAARAAECRAHAVRIAA